MEIVKKRIEIRDKVVSEATEWVNGLKYRVSAVLIGSYARGDFNVWSDVDIILISDEFKGNPVERLKKINVPPGYEVIPLTPKEFKKLLKKNDALAREAVEKGVKLRDDFRIFTTKENLS